MVNVNASKTKVVVFSKGKVRQIIATQYDYTYLGTTFNYNGNFHKAITKQISQAKRALFSLIGKSRQLQLPVDIQSHLFDSCIVPILLYGSEVWGFSDPNKLK